MHIINNRYTTLSVSIKSLNAFFVVLSFSSGRTTLNILKPSSLFPVHLCGCLSTTLNCLWKDSIPNSSGHHFGTINSKLSYYFTKLLNAVIKLLQLLFHLFGYLWIHQGDWSLSWKFFRIPTHQLTALADFCATKENPNCKPTIVCIKDYKGARRRWQVASSVSCFGIQNIECFLEEARISDVF